MSNEAEFRWVDNYLRHYRAPGVRTSNQPFRSEFIIVVTTIGVSFYGYTIPAPKGWTGLHVHHADWLNTSLSMCSNWRAAIPEVNLAAIVDCPSRPIQCGCHGSYVQFAGHPVGPWGEEPW